MDQKNSSQQQIQTENSKDSMSNDKKKPHIKKPLNAFMLYMKEMRAKVVAECTLKESAAINQILGRKVNINKLLILLLITYLNYLYNNMMIQNLMMNYLSQFSNQ